MSDRACTEKRTRNGLAGLLAAIGILSAGLASAEHRQPTLLDAPTLAGVAWDDALLSGLTAWLPEARLRRVAAHRPMSANFDHFATGAFHPSAHEAVGLGLYLRSPAVESWRLEASTRRMPVRPRSVELLDFGAGLARHRFTESTHRVRSLGLETDIGSAFGVRIDWNRYENAATDFHILGIGFTYRLR